jgi:hypothetical protein
MKAGTSKRKPQRGRRTRKPKNSTKIRSRKVVSRERNFRISERELERILKPYIKDYLRTGKPQKDGKYSRYHKYPMETAYDDSQRRLDRREKKLDDFYAQVYKDQKGYIKELMRLLEEERKGSYKMLEKLIIGLFGYSQKEPKTKRGPEKLAPTAPVAPVAPTAPVAPVAPTAPVAPVAPTAPVAPVAPTRRPVYSINQLPKYAEMTREEIVSIMLRNLSGKDCEDYVLGLGKVGPGFEIYNVVCNRPDFFPLLTPNDLEGIRNTATWIDENIYESKLRGRVKGVVSDNLRLKTYTTLSDYKSTERKYRSKAVTLHDNPGTIEITKMLAEMRQIRTGDAVEVVFPYVDGGKRVRGMAEVVSCIEAKMDEAPELHLQRKIETTDLMLDAVSLYECDHRGVGVYSSMGLQRGEVKWASFYLERLNFAP